MKAYVKPMVLELEDIAEGIYAASGEVVPTSNDEPEVPAQPVDYDNDPECWIPSYREIQRVSSNPSDSFVIYEIKGEHKTGLKHISAKQRVSVMFSSPDFSSAVCQEYPVTINGCTVEFEREKLADAYGSGDNFICNIRLNCTPEVAAKISVTGVTIYCTHKENVQGGWD